MNYDVKNFSSKDLLTIAAIAAAIILLLFSFSAKYSKWQTTVDDIITFINENKSEIDYNQYLSVEVAKSKIIFDKTHMNKEVIDSDFCNLLYHVYIKNITSEDVEVSFKFYIPKEMTSSIIWGDTTVGDLDSSKEILKPGQGYGVTLGTLMKHPDKLSIEENKVFEKFKSTLYMELAINGKKAYDLVKYISE